MPIVSFEIEHPAEGPMLVDTGAHPSLKVMHDVKRVREQITADPATILMTHLHFDHTAGLRDFPGTRLLISRPEWEAFHSGRPLLHGYEPKHVREQNHTIELLDYEEADLFGDGSVRLLPTPGHTLGHLSLLVRTASGPVLVCGDAIYTLDNLKPGHEPLHCEDREAWRRSVDTLRARTDGAVVIPGHDPAAWKSLHPLY
jgi:glyoxylase-like metal-dependent hydrolase (beta-lactamase superfamily II)